MFSFFPFKFKPRRKTPPARDRSGRQAPRRLPPAPIGSAEPPRQDASIALHVVLQKGPSSHSKIFASTAPIAPPWLDSATLCLPRLILTRPVCRCPLAPPRAAMLSLVLQGGLNPDVSSAPYFFGMMGAAVAMVFASTLAATVSCQHTNRRRVSPPSQCAPPPRTPANSALACGLRPGTFVWWPWWSHRLLPLPERCTDGGASCSATDLCRVVRAQTLGRRTEQPRVALASQVSV